MSDEFYIGWQAAAPPGIAWRIRRVVVGLIALAVILGGLLAAGQRTIGRSVFEWGRVKTFAGILKGDPYPHLLVPRPGASEGPAAFSSYYLVNPFKFGLDRDGVKPLEGMWVELRGTIIHRENQTMIEVVEGSIQPASAKEAVSTQAVSPSISLGEQTLSGEIVDSKCYLGVMNPGALIPHRACAIRCISGGVPPVLLVRRATGTPLYFLLVARDGAAVNREVLGMVAEPLEITGEVRRQGDLLVLYADPSTYRRIGE
jgi:hypothetical protein